MGKYGFWIIIVLMAVVIIILLFLNKSTYWNHRVGGALTTGSQVTVQALPKPITVNGITAVYFSVVSSANGSNTMQYYDANKNVLTNFQPSLT